MDYYNLTVFEFTTDRLGAQGTVCGGGRYDTLIEQLGGKPAPAVGWGLGIERLLELLKEQGTEPVLPVPDVYAVIAETGMLAQAMALLQTLRRLGVRVHMHAGTSDGMGSLKSQFKKADASGARFALVFAQQEMAQGAVAIKSLRDGIGEQHQVMICDVATWAQRLQSRDISESPNGI
jgi:histidyl-tRNA synthetase